jgi:Ca-activated chloride channel family protein
VKILYPKVLWILLLCVPVIAIVALEFLRGRRELPILGGTGSRDATATVWLVKWFFAGLSFVLFVGFAVLSLAGFTWGSRPVQHTRSGLEIALVLDVSRSMLADDVRPSRLERASVVVQGLVGQLPNARFSMIVYKGEAVKVVPMTEDSTVIESVLVSVGPAMLTSPGTDVAAGIETAVDSFPPGSDRNRIIVLFSDGEYLDRSPLRVAAEAGNRDIPVYAVACGTRAGSTIELSDGRRVRDTDGQVVVSKVNLTALRQVSSLSDGRVFLLGDADILSQLLSVIETYDDVRRTQGFRLEEVRRYRLFLSLALLFLLVSMTVRTVRWKDAF